MAAASGGEVDCQPRLSWLGRDDDSDAVVLPIAEIAELRPQSRFALADVSNPYGLALGRGIDLNKALKDDPTVGSIVLDGLVEEVRSHIKASLHSGADGIFYRLHGATPIHCTPMQYGGHYLERDRELLDEAKSAAFNVIFVVGKAVLT